MNTGLKTGLNAGLTLGPLEPGSGVSTPAAAMVSSRGLNASDPLTLTVDIGGTNIKALVLKNSGEIVRQRESLPTPSPATPPAVLSVIETLAERLSPFDRVAIGFPGVVQKGITRTAPNLSPAWKDFFLEGELEQRLKVPVRIANDADVQGFGAISGKGVELVLTLGTGMGSALFIDGILVPNLELPHHPFEQNATYEQRLGQAALERLGLEEWQASLSRAIALLRATFNFDCLYIGGGNARMLHEASLPADVRLVQNILGLIGGLALWTRVQGTSLVRAPQAEGAHCLIVDSPASDSPFESTPGVG